tara:strand:+ start:332 stop:1225 length:894 start_codon:yes stop_codon:yes gene_type:complete
MRLFKQDRKLDYNKAQRLQDSWKDTKEIKESKSRDFREVASSSILVAPVEKNPSFATDSIEAGIKFRVQAEPYWFQKIEILPGLYSPGWSDPVTEKLPYFGLPEDLSGLRVLDIGCAEGFFSFEAEKRGAREVIGIDSFSDSVRRFNIVKEAHQSNATAFLTNVYELNPSKFGTFDLVLFYGVFYHLKHPQLALERIRSVCKGDLLFQTHICEESSIKDEPWAKYHPHGMVSGKNNELYDPTIFWHFNSACCIAMLESVGFENIAIVSDVPNPFVASASSPVQEKSEPPDQTESPWC